MRIPGPYQLSYTPNPEKGNPNALPGPVLVTHDAGAAWHSADVDPAAIGFLRDLACADAQDCRAVGPDLIYGTKDGGSTWHKQSVEGGERSFPDLQGIACPAADTCYAVGDEAILGTHPPSPMAESSRGAVQDQSVTPSPTPVPASAATSPMPTKTPLPGASRILYQVRSQSWKQSIKSWIPHPAGAWTVRTRALTSTGTGRKLCDFDEGVKYCRYEALIIAPYRLTATSYAIEAELRFPDSKADPMQAGIVFRAHGTSGNPVPWLVANQAGIFANCRYTGPSLGMCGYTGSLKSRGPARYFGNDGGWHVYRVEVRGRHYRLLIDGKKMETVTDKRPKTDFGDRFEFFAANDPVVPQSISIRRVTVVALQPSAQAP